MAAFSSYQHPSFLADCVYLPNVSATKMNGISDDFMPNFHQQLYASSGHCQNPVTYDHDNSSFDASAHGSCTDQQSMQNNEPFMTEKQRTQSLSKADKAESSEQVSQIIRAPADKMRKSKNGSSSNSANSKDAKRKKCKKQKGDKEATNDEQSGNNDQSKPSEEPPKGYIHVRARRGQATDSHSLAERVRREKISERMRMLQAIVPGCDKVNGKALMLDEIINYVQSLQIQVEFLSMKLASVDPMVYTFGLMDLDTMLLGTEVINNDMVVPMPLMQLSNSGYGCTTQSTSFANASALPSSTSSSSTTSASNIPSPHADGSLNLLQPEQRPTLFPLQGAGSSYWGLDEQERQNIINQFGFSANNLYFLQ